ncbi:macrodontain-1 [Brachypodium distachyon]|nr:macrodontain-1 [Brachypodium distachyon]|eukprot:XP_003559143.2 macrodontain-1 [Brachypodium distachyon]
MSSEGLKAAGYGGCAYPYYDNNKLPLHNKGNNSKNVSAAVVLEPPAQRDWRVKGAVTEVKNQNPCGGCWAFAAAAAVESLVFLKTGSLIPLSEQQLIDCDTSSPNKGCNGGSVAKAFIYISSTGLTSQEHYPYERSQGPCEAEMDTPVFARISGFASVPPFDGDAMLRRVAVQPVAAVIAVNENVLTGYTGGVFTGLCGSPTVWHAVTVVGYGTHDDDGDGTSLNYWVVKNSWGPSWGEGGYIRISRDEGGNDGLCRILFNPLYLSLGESL